MPPSVPKRPRRDISDSTEALEVQGFDLMAQIEAMLRHARQYQREVQRLRGIMGKGQTGTQDLPPVDAVRTQINALRSACVTFTEILDAMVETAGSIPRSRPHIVRSRRR